MRAVVEPLEGNRVKLSIEVDEQEFEKDIDAAFRRIAREVRIPGFRPGKAPRRILEARLGKEAGRSEALRDALPNYYSRAVRQHEVDVVAAPEIDIRTGGDSGPVAFDAVVEVRPQISVPGYAGLRVEIPNPAVTDADVDEEVDRLRKSFGELRVADRPARTGDFLTIDVSGTRGGEPLPGLSADDFLYELGSGSVLPELDDRLAGAKVGDILAFDAEVGEGGPASLRVLVKEVKERILPEVTDEWAAEASEFDTIEELRADIVKRLSAVKRVRASFALRNAVVDALVELVSEDPPQSLLDAEMQREIEELQRRLSAQGAGLEEYLRYTGQTPDQLVEELRRRAEPAVKADLALRAVAEAEGIEPSEEDIEHEIARLASSFGIKPAQARRNLERNDQMLAVRSEWKKNRALSWLLDHAEIVDPAGQPVDRSLLEPVASPAAGPEIVEDAQEVAEVEETPA
jgi:trigger factor